MGQAVPAKRKGPVHGQHPAAPVQQRRRVSPLPQHPLGQPLESEHFGKTGDGVALGLEQPPFTFVGKHFGHDQQLTPSSPGPLPHGRKQGLGFAAPGPAGVNGHHIINLPQRDR